MKNNENQWKMVKNDEERWKTVHHLLCITCGASPAVHHLRWCITCGDASLIRPPSSYLTSSSHTIFKNMAYVGSFSHFVFVFSLSLSLSLPVSLSLSSPSVHPPSSYLLSSSHTIFKNMAHVGSFSHFIFVFVHVFVFFFVTMYFILLVMGGPRLLVNNNKPIRINELDSCCYSCWPSACHWVLTKHNLASIVVQQMV